MKYHTALKTVGLLIALGGTLPAAPVPMVWAAPLMPLIRTAAVTLSGNGLQPIKTAQAAPAELPDTAPAPQRLLKCAAGPAKPMPARTITAARKSATKRKKSSASLSVAGKTQTAAERQARAMKAYRNYQYVKLMGPITGPMYHSTKW